MTRRPFAPPAPPALRPLVAILSPGEAARVPQITQDDEPRAKSQRVFSGVRFLRKATAYRGSCATPGVNRSSRVRRSLSDELVLTATFAATFAPWVASARHG